MTTVVRTRVAVSVAISLGVGCRPASSTQHRASASVQPSAPTERTNPSLGSACVGLVEAAAERVTLSPNSAATVASGLEVHFVAVSFDHYEDGSFDALAEFRFGWGEQSAAEIVSVVAPSDPPVFRGLLDHCWRVASLDGDDAVVQVSLAPGFGRTLRRCVDVPVSGLPRLDSDSAVEAGARFVATLRYDEASHDWVVVPTPTILHHHSTGIEWANLAAWGREGLGQARGQDVTVALRFVSSEVQAVAGERAWRSRHLATIDSACLS